MNNTKRPKLSVIDRFRKIVDESQYAKIQGTTIDLTTASVVCQVYDRLHPKNQAHLVSMPARRIALVCLELAGLK